MKILLVACFVFFSVFANGQVGIGTTNPHPSAALEISSSSRGLLIPRLSSVQRQEINDPTTGLIFYNTSLDSIQYRSNQGWRTLLAGPVSTVYASDGLLRSNRTIGLDSNWLVFSSGTTEVLRLSPAGTVGINNSSPSLAYKLDINGDLRANGDIYTQSIVLSSDIRLKRNIEPLVNSLRLIQKINGYTYYWKDTLSNNRLQYGLLAQELEQVFPEMVYTQNNGNKAVNYQALIPLLLEAIKEQQKQINFLKEHLLIKKEDE